MIFLHGAGITGFGMERWLTGMVTPPPGLVVLLPSAPMREYSLEGKKSSVWHQRKEVDIRGKYEDIVGIDEMCDGLIEMVERVKSIGADEVSLGGFSMGGHLALHAAYRRDVKVEKCFALSSYIIESSAVFEHQGDRVGCPPLFMAHGVEDKIVPLDWGRRTRDRLDKAGVKTKWNAYPGLGHEPNSEVMRHLFDWVGE